MCTFSFCFCFLPCWTVERYDRSNKVRFISLFYSIFGGKINDKTFNGQKKLWAIMFMTIHNKKGTHRVRVVTRCLLFRFFIVRYKLWVSPFWPELTHLLWHYTESLSIYWMLFDSFLMVNWTVCVCVLNLFVVICSVAFSRLRNKFNESLSIY